MKFKCRDNKVVLLTFIKQFSIVGKLFCPNQNIVWIVQLYVAMKYYSLTLVIVSTNLKLTFQHNY